MKKIILAIFAIITFSLLIPQPKVSAKTLEHSVSAKLAMATDVKKEDNRAKVLRDYLITWNSPLADHASTFIEQADKYKLDWRLVAAISGLESQFGKQIPYNSYNGWGWGIYGTHSLGFKSWDEAIITISAGLRNNYLKDKVESDPYFIGPTYAASPTWAQRVDYFMRNISAFEESKAKDELSISI